MSFKKIDVKDFTVNPYTIFAKEWMLLSAGKKDTGYNTMTISWGHLGSIWGHGGGKPTAVVYVRPSRYTKEFVDKEDYFTLCVFDEEYKKALGYLGSNSGRDGNKIEAVGLTPAFTQDSIYFEEAKLVIVCKKMYHSTLKEEGFLDESIISENYPLKDFHEMYIGEIVEIFEKE